MVTFLGNTEILYNEAGTTYQDINLYVNGTTGNDVTGNGSAANPFASIPRAWEFIPKIIEHKVNVRIAAGTYTSFPETIRHVINGSGQLVVEGLGNPTELAGPFTVTAVTHIVSGSDSLGWDITVSGVGWTDSFYKGKWIKYTSGITLNGRIIPIFSNDTDTIRHNSTQAYYPVEVGATFVIVEPSVKINISDDTTVFNIRSNGVNRYSNVLFANLEFTNVSSESTAFLFTNTGKFLTGCVVFRNSSQYTFTTSIVGGNINDASTVPTDITQLVNERFIGAANIEGYAYTWPDIILENTYGGTLKNWVLHFGNNVANSYLGISVAGRVTTHGYTEFRTVSGGILQFSLVGHLECDHQSMSHVTNSIIHELTSATAFRVDDSTRLEVSACIITAANTGFSIEDACMVQLDRVEIVAANVSGYGLRLGRGSRVVVNAPSSLDGTISGVYFTQLSAAQAVPGAPGRITDGFGSDLIT